MASPPPLMGLLLAGGSSSRMGADKAALTVGGRTLLERAWSRLEPCVAEARVSVRAAQADDVLRGAYPLLQDEPDVPGPAAGLLAAHRVFPDHAWLVLACDMPLLTRFRLNALIAARDPACEATVWQAHDAAFPEPLCAIYEPATLAAFRAHVMAGGKASPSAWLAGRKLKRLDPGAADWLRSANTPEEFAAMLAQAAEEAEHE